MRKREPKYINIDDLKAEMLEIAKDSNNLNQQLKSSIKAVDGLKEDSYNVMKQGFSEVVKDMNNIGKRLDNLERELRLRTPNNVVYIILFPLITLLNTGCIIYHFLFSKTPNFSEKSNSSETPDYLITTEGEKYESDLHGSVKPETDEVC